MPQKRSAYKELRKSKRRHASNAGLKTEIKTLIKSFNSLLSQKKFDQAKDALQKIFSRFDKAAAKGVIHKNTVSRKISRLSKKLHTAGGKK
ncbi:MAG: 30S ribosomal protein S20 [Candidatus Omnitrophica bacterium]|nr:30S ribosomal protein S20 [Candidatus Omnitrophota bacterium]